MSKIPSTQIPFHARICIGASRAMLSDSVAAIACHVMDVSLKDVQSVSRKTRLVYTRYIIAQMMKRNAARTLKQVGAMFGNRHHSTVIHAQKKFHDIYDTDQNFRFAFMRACDLLRQGVTVTPPEYSTEKPWSDEKVKRPAMVAKMESPAEPDETQVIHIRDNYSYNRERMYDL